MGVDLKMRHITCVNTDRKRTGQLETSGQGYHVSRFGNASAMMGIEYGDARK